MKKVLERALESRKRKGLLTGDTEQPLPSREQLELEAAAFFDKRRAGMAPERRAFGKASKLAQSRD